MKNQTGEMRIRSRECSKCGGMREVEFPGIGKTLWPVNVPIETFKLIGRAMQEYGDRNPDEIEMIDLLYELSKTKPILQ